MTAAVALSMKTRPATLHLVGVKGQRTDKLLAWIGTLLGVELTGYSSSLRQAKSVIAQQVPDILVIYLDPMTNTKEVYRSVTKVRTRHPQVRIVLLGSDDDCPAHLLDTTHIRRMSLPTQNSRLESWRDEFLAQMANMAGDIRRVSNQETHATGPQKPSASVSDSIDMGLSRRQASFRSGDIDVILMAASTGGPDVLDTYLQRLISTGVTLPILLVQHIPAKYSTTLAAHLQKLLDYPCAEAKDGEVLESKRIYLAPGDQHMRLNAGKLPYISLDQSAPIMHCRPSADVLFSSAASVFGKRTLAVVLTGMGSDGCDGARQIVAAGGQVLAQDQSSSAVWGMPGAVVAAGLAKHVGNPQKLAQITHSIVKGK